MIEFSERRSVETPARLSFVVPVFNGCQTVGSVVDDILSASAGFDTEIILVNDGSTDASEEVCAGLADRFPGQVIFLQLARNFGEHSAVLAGLKYAGGDYAAVLDDDGQHRAEDAMRMFEHARREHLDVVYGRYQDRQHPRLRILGSWLNDRVANVMLKKPRDLYLSSFKVMSRLVVDEVCRYSGPSPYIDGLILRATSSVGQIDVEHRARMAGRSGYTLSKLIGLWMNMCMGFSLAPVRVLTLLGMLGAVLGVTGLVGAGVWRFLVDPQASIGAALLVSSLLIAGGIQLFAVGILGEYIARVFLHQNGSPQSVLRYVRAAEAGSASRQLKSRRPLKYTAG